MRKRLQAICCFSIVFVLLLFTISVPFHKYAQYGDQYATIMEKCQSFQKEKEQSIDVAFVGDSIAWSGYSPLALYKQTGITSYNCSTSGQWIRESYLMLQQILKSQKIKVFILDTNLFYVRLMQIKDLRDFIVGDVFSVIQYHDMLFKDISAKGKDNWKGYHFSNVVTDCHAHMEYMTDNSPMEELPEVSKKYLEKIYDLCKANNISLVLCSSPNPSRWNAGRSLAVSDWAEKHKVDYLDGNKDWKSIGIDGTTDYIDCGEHLNFNGARKLTSYIGKYLMEHYKLKNHSGNSEWDRDLDTVGVYNE